ncbi:15-O-acetyltransferase Tri3 [Aureobasidium sp. EXF-3400]|nr:15-O-acetyltransferase Tri3 [Aureobasidium sp. EXF-12344]KAI4772802.1 15-O-acetyltransferase Tri3 [Aureobasidium sp. EXF-3400]
MAIIESKTVEPAKYRWHKVHDATGSVQRRGNGTENWVGLRKENARGQYDCYILLKATIQHPFTLTSLKQRLVHGLLKERFERPNIACKAFWDEQFGPLLRYTPPSDREEAVSWAQQSVEIRATSQSGLELRRDIVSKRKSQKKSSDSFTVYILADVSDTDTLITKGSSLEMLVHFNHIYWDGISARHFVSRFLDSVGQDLEDAQYDWGSEIDNLSAPILDSLKIDPQTLGKDYDNSLEEFVSIMFNFGSSHAMTIGTDPGFPDTAVLQLTPSECHKIIQAVKTRVGAEYTITHLGQAATLLTLLKLSPIPKEVLSNRSVIMPLPVNGRRYLREGFADTQYGSCQACAVVVFENLEQYVLDFGNKDAVISGLIGAMKTTKTAYDRWLNKPYLLPLGLAKDNFLSALMESSETEPDGKVVPVSLSLCDIRMY